MTIDIDVMERDASWRGLPDKATKMLELLNTSSGVRAVELEFGSPRQADAADRKLDTAPEILAFLLGAVLSIVVAIVALAIGRTGAAILMMAPLTTALLGLGFIGLTSMRR